MLVSGARLLDLSQSVWQTIEGTFVGFPSEADAKGFLEADWDLTQFAIFPAEIAVEALEGSGFNVYLRSRLLADRLAQHLADVRWQDPGEFLKLE